MSDPVSALKGARYQGFATVADAGPRGMVTLRGDLSSEALRQAACNAVGVDFPQQRGIVTKGEAGLGWMSPDEVLILCPYADARAIAAKLGAALAGTHHLAVNVSDARAMFIVSGGDAREVMAKVTPADVSPLAFAPGDIRRTRLAQVAGAFWMTDETTFNVICFRSVAQYVYDLLAISARPGSEVEYF